MALALPLLESMRHAPRVAYGAEPGLTAAGFPKRFVVFFSPNGTLPDRWIPSGGERDFQLSQILAPLEPIKKKVLIVQGVDQQGANGDGHQNGMVGMLTGRECNPGPFKGGDGGSAGWANGISIDQHLANVLGSKTQQKSLELAALPGGQANNWTRMCYTGPDAPVTPVSDPYKVFDSLFKNLSNTPNEKKLALDRQRTVLDAVMSDFKALTPKVSRADAQRLEEHLGHIRDIESRLGVAPTAAVDSCKAPDLGTRLDPNKNDNYPIIGDLQQKLLVMALACDLTRIASMQWNRSVGDVNFTWLGIDRGHHDMSHDGDSNADTLDKITKINIWYAQRYTELCQMLDAIPEGDGTMLDNTIVLWCNELGKGNSHTRKDAPYVIAGGAGGAIEVGRYLSFAKNKGDVPHNNLLLSLVNAMGLEDKTFGKPEWCTGPLPGVLKV